MSTPTGRRRLVTLCAERVLAGGLLLEPGRLTLDAEAGVVAPADAPAGEVVELGDRIVAPGFVDVHVHGGDGAQVNSDDADEVVASLATIARFHARHGTTAFLATTVSDSPDRLRSTVSGIRVAAAAGACPDGARLLGAHLEGPFLSPARPGAQDPDALRPPDPDELSRLLATGDGTVSMITLAPELDGAFDLISAALAGGCLVSLGHSDADYETARRAFAAGARHVTHLFNGMAPFHHRAPGLAGAALAATGVTVELIADNEHVHPAALEIAWHCLGDRLVAVSDAAPAAGLAEGRYHLGRLPVTVSGRRVELADRPGTLAGSALTLDRAVENLAAAGVPLLSALRAAGEVPSRLCRRLGTLEPGAPADLVVLDPDLSLCATIVGGRAVFDDGGILPPLSSQ